MQASRQDAPFQAQFSGNKGSRFSDHLGLLLQMVLAFIKSCCFEGYGYRSFVVVAYIYVLPAIMRHVTTILFFSFATTLCFGQTKKELKVISAFKKNFLKSKKQIFYDTLIIGNLRITGEIFYEHRVIKTFEKGKDYVAGEQFYDNIKQIKEVIKYDTVGHPIGIAKHYTKKGELQYIQNYDNGEWIVYD
jgi:hypothetical protein